MLKLRWLRTSHFSMSERLVGVAIRALGLIWNKTRRLRWTARSKAHADRLLSSRRQIIDFPRKNISLSLGGHC